MARPISDRYRRRAQNVGRESLRLRNAMQGVLKRGLEEATKEELYDRTPLKVSHDMMKSIRTRLIQGGVQVGYFAGKGARYAKYRVNMKGISKLGGHLLDMQPSKLLKKKADPEIRRLTKAAQRRIIG
jgi:hypothetical protein